MDTLGIEPRASRMLSGGDTTTPRAHLKIFDVHVMRSLEHPSTKNVVIASVHASKATQTTVASNAWIAPISSRWEREFREPWPAMGTDPGACSSIHETHGLIEHFLGNNVDVRGLGESNGHAGD